MDRIQTLLTIAAIAVSATALAAPAAHADSTRACSSTSTILISGAPGPSCKTTAALCATNTCSVLLRIRVQTTSGLARGHLIGFNEFAPMGFGAVECGPTAGSCATSLGESGPFRKDDPFQGNCTGGVEGLLQVVTVFCEVTTFDRPFTTPTPSPAPLPTPAPAPAGAPRTTCAATKSGSKGKARPARTSCTTTAATCPRDGCMIAERVRVKARRGPVSGRLRAFNQLNPDGFGSAHCSGRGKTCAATLTAGPFPAGYTAQAECAWSGRAAAPGLRVSCAVATSS